MMNAKNSTLGSVAVLFVLLPNAAAEEPACRYVKTKEGHKPKPIVAVDNVCAWPNLTVLPDETVVATIFNQPSHAGLPGDVDCWASTDGGRTWQKRGTPAPHDPTTNRMNVAAGLAAEGDLIVIASGWSKRYRPGEKVPPGEKRRVLDPWVCRSQDGARTWDIDKQAFPNRAPNGGTPIPFGDILRGHDGALRVAVYTWPKQRVYVYRSDDDGRTWGGPVPLHEDALRTETAICHLGDGNWLAAARTHLKHERDSRHPHGLDMHLELYGSDDDAQTWQPRGPIASHPMHHPAHFLRLRDGRLIFSYGNRAGDGTPERSGNGVEILVSTDEGKSWSKPLRVLDWQGDGGYPSSVELPDGQVLTAYYARHIAGHDGYHMGVAVWSPQASLTP